MIGCSKTPRVRTEMLPRRFLQSVRESTPAGHAKDARGIVLLATRRYGYTVFDLYHTERNHQGLGNRLIRPHPPEASNQGVIVRHQRLGGMLNYYYRAAA
jgi:hypothetical protein